jgi:hypothetical protein
MTETRPRGIYLTAPARTGSAGKEEVQLLGHVCPECGLVELRVNNPARFRLPE